MREVVVGTGMLRYKLRALIEHVALIVHVALTVHVNLIDRPVNSLWT